MRTRTENLASRRARRNLLAALLILTSPVVADQPKPGPIQTMPPLPLARSTPAGVVRENPFFQPDGKSSIPPVQLASGGERVSNERLAPIGAAIGLQSIDGSRAKSNSRPAMTIEVVESSGIRTNPLVTSTHHTNTELVDAAATGAHKVVPTTTIVDAADAADGARQAILVRPTQGTHQVQRSHRVQISDRVQATQPARAVKATKSPLQSPVVIEHRELQPKAVESATNTGAPSVGTPTANSPQATDEILFHLGDQTEQPQPAANPVEFSLTDVNSDQRSQPTPAPQLQRADMTPVVDANARPSETPTPAAPKVASKPANASKPIEFSLSSQDSDPASGDPQIQPTLVAVEPTLVAVESKAVLAESSEAATPTEVATTPNEVASEPSREPVEFSIASQSSETVNSGPQAITRPTARLVPVPIEPDMMSSLEPVSEPIQISRSVLPLSRPSRTTQPQPAMPEHAAVAEPELATPSNPAQPAMPMIANAVQATPKIVTVPPANPSVAVETPPVDSLVRRPVQLMPVPITPIEYGPAAESMSESESVTMAPVEVESLASDPVDIQPVVIESPTAVEVSIHDSTTSARLTDVAQAEIVKPKMEPQVVAEPAVIEQPIADQPIAVEEQLASEQPVVIEQPRVADVRPLDSMPNSEPIELAQIAPPELIVVEQIDPPRPLDSVREENADTPSLYRTEPLVIAPVETLETQPVDNVRAPIAVRQVPAALSRSILQVPTQTDSAVHPVQALALDQRQPVMDSEFKGTLTALPMQRGKVRSLKVGDRLDRFEVEDEGVCQVLQTGNNELKLIGIQPGKTRLIVHASVGDGSQIQTRGFEIQVNEIGAQFVSPLAEQCTRMNRSLAKAFPNCQVQLRVHRDRLVLGGTCENDELAREIVRMVRKACLVPVQDQLVVQ